MQESNLKNLIYFSTDMVYGMPLSLPLKEDHPLNPIGLYGASKKLSEEILQSYDINFCIFRPRMIIGKNRLGILEKLFNALRLGLPIPLIGDGSNVYQMISVFDCVNAICRCVSLLKESKALLNETFNLGSKNPPTIKTLLNNLISHHYKLYNSKEYKMQSLTKSFLIPTNASLIQKILRFLEKRDLSPMYKEQYEIANKQYIISTSKLENLLGFTPKHSDEDMLKQAFDSYMQNFKK